MLIIHDEGNFMMLNLENTLFPALIIPPLDEGTNDWAEVSRKIIETIRLCKRSIEISIC